MDIENMIFAEEKKKEENIWRRKIFFAEEKEKEENIHRCTSMLKPALFLFGPDLLRLQHNSEILFF